jgi:iron complex outermembrane receptor protein
VWRLRNKGTNVNSRNGVAKAVRRSLGVAPLMLVSGIALADEVAAPAPVLEEIVVFGRGETRQVQSVAAVQIEQLPPGTSPLKAVEKLPGVNFQSADPYGAYEWSTRISIRGFNQNQLGFTLDGVPLGDMSYGNHNGLHASRAVSSENVGRIVVSQGAGALDTASTSNLGGTLEFLTDDPSQEFGVRGAVTGGSDSALRLFARLDSGELGSLGTRAFLSYTDQETDKWKGGGVQEQQQVNFKLVQPIGGATLTGYYAWSDRAEQDYQDLSLDIIARLGPDTDNFFPDWAGAVAAADACAAAGFNATICDDRYWNASGLREDTLAYLKLDIPFGEALTWSTTGYLHQNEGMGLWGTPYVPTPGGAPLSVRTTEYEIDRYGVISALTARYGRHEINGGVWVEDNDFDQARRFYGEPNRAAPTRSFLEFQKDPFFTQWEYTFNTRTVQWHLQDTWSVTDAVKLNFGFKSVKVENEGEPIIATGNAINQKSAIDAEDSFIPQAGVTWAINDANEVFASYAENMRAFVSAATAGPFSTTQNGFNAIVGSLEPETSKTYELGWRFRAGSVQGVASVYSVDFKDRLLAISLGPSIVGAPSALTNVGSVQTQGFELGVLWEPIQYVSVFGSYSYTDSTYDDDVVTGTGAVIPTKGKTVVDTPENMLKGEIGYDDGRLFAKVGFDYIDERYFTYLNDQKVDSRTLVDLSLGFRLKDLGFLRQLTIQGNVTNATDEDYISTVGSGGFGNSGDRQTLLTGAPRQYFITLDGRF